MPSLAHHITAAYNTGPMFSCTGAWANDADMAAIGAPWALFDDFSDPALPGWEDRNANTSALDGKLISTVTGPGVGASTKQFASVAATNYVATADYAGGSVSGVLSIGTSPGGTDIAISTPQSSAGKIVLPFTSTGTTAWISLRSNSATSGEFTEWDEATVQEENLGTDILKDNSGRTNDGLVVGQVTRPKFNRCTYGVCCDDINYVRLTGSTGDDLQGWFRPLGNGQLWRYFEGSSEIPEIEKSGNDYLLKNGCYGFLMLSGSEVDLGDYSADFGGSFD